MPSIIQGPWEDSFRHGHNTAGCLIQPTCRMHPILSRWGHGAGDKTTTISMETLSVTGSTCPLSISRCQGSAWELS